MYNEKHLEGQEYMYSKQSTVWKLNVVLGCVEILKALLVNIAVCESKDIGTFW